jgi:hypothetical protein
MDKIKQQLDITMEEYNRVAVINTTIRDQLVAEQDKTHRMEESLKVCGLTNCFLFLCFQFLDAKEVIYFKQ